MKQSTPATLPTVGILGDGQLAMMMAEAYQKLGGKVAILAASDSAPASQVADHVFVGNIEDASSTEAFFNAVDVVTLENEFNDAQLMVDLAKQFSKSIYPEPAKFSLIEDKLSEKQYFESLDVPMAQYMEITDESQLPDEPGYLKLAKGGYDGIGTYRVSGRSESVPLFEEIKHAGTILFEYAIDFKQELSLIGVSNKEQIVFYPLVGTEQAQGTCLYVTYPCELNESIQQQAQDYVSRILEKLDTKGLFAFEFFLTKGDQLLINESAPRPHNSGHITMNLADCSQFENHMRAVTGLPLREPKMLAESMTMLNLLATKEAEFNDDEVLARIKDTQCSATLYRKASSRVKRKMGHVNIWGENQRQRAEEILEQMDI